MTQARGKRIGKSAIRENGDPGCLAEEDRMRLAPAAAKRDDGEGRQERRADIPFLWQGKTNPRTDPQSGSATTNRERAPASPTSRVNARRLYKTQEAGALESRGGLVP